MPPATFTRLIALLREIVAEIVDAFVVVVPAVVAAVFIAEKEEEDPAWNMMFVESNEEELSFKFAGLGDGATRALFFGTAGPTTFEESLLLLLLD